MKSVTESWTGNFMNSDSDSHSLLTTAIIEILDQSETPIDTRALLDSESQLNFITTNLANCLNLKVFKTPYQICGLKGDEHQFLLGSKYKCKI